MVCIEMLRQATEDTHERIQLGLKLRLYSRAPHLHRERLRRSEELAIRPEELRDRIRRCHWTPTGDIEVQAHR
jgi:hypothetical protein